MSAISDDALASYILDTLEAAERRDIAARLSSEPELAARLAELELTLHSLALALPPVPAPTFRERLLADARAEANAPLLAPLARLCDVTIERAKAFLQLIDTWTSWDPLMPGVRFVDVDGGPALAGARPGLVHVEPEVRFPTHVHRGDETCLYLRGEARFADGSLARPGDLITMPDGSVHGFTVTSAVPLVFAVVLGDIDMVDPVD